MKRSGVKLILAETYQNRPIIDEIARQTGAKALILPSSVSEDQGIKTVFEFSTGSTARSSPPCERPRRRRETLPLLAVGPRGFAVAAF